MTTQQKPRRAPIRRTLTPLQKKREMVLTILGVEKVELANKVGVSAQLIANIFNDRHRSPDAEQGVVKYLNKRLDTFEANSPEREMLAGLGIPYEPITVRDLGWPKPI